MSVELPKISKEYKDFSTLCQSEIMEHGTAEVSLAKIAGYINTLKELCEKMAEGRSSCTEMTD
jgi:hypothetical protein